MRLSTPSLLTALGFILVLGVQPATAGEYRVLIDVDDDATTGCLVTTAGSTFDGVEQIVTTTVDNGTDQVTAVDRRECVDPDTDTFGAPIAVSEFPTPWAVGVGLGAMGSDVVETYFPRSVLPDDTTSVRLGYASDDGMGSQDVMFTTTGGSGGDPIVVTLGATPNNPPSAMADDYQTEEDTDLVIPAPGVLVNDSDVDVGDTLTAVLDTDVSDGTLTLDGDGSFTYDPNLNFNGTDSFTYHATDGTADSATVTVTITVEAVNDGPNAVDDNFATDEDTPLNVAAPGVLTNDTDPEMDSLSVVTHDATSAQGAAVTVNDDGSFAYDPTGAAALQALAGGTTLDDTFTYTIEDPSGVNPDTAEVTVEVTGVDDPPTAVLDIPTIGPGGLVLLGLLLAGAAAWVLRNANRFAGGGTVAAVLLMVILAPLALAVADIVLDGDPSDWVGGIDAQGTDPVADVPTSADILAGYAAVSTDGTILFLRLDVTREAQPEAVDDAFTVTEDDPQTIFDVLANDTDVDGALKEVISVTQPANGTVAITGGGADVGYTPDADYCNDGTPTDDFTYTVNGGSIASVAVTVDCVDDAPTATGEVFDG